MDNSVIQIIGYFAAVVGTISFLPQVIRCYGHKKATDISLKSFLLLTSGTILWFVYGLFKSNGPLIVANMVIGLCLFIILYYKLKYG